MLESSDYPMIVSMMGANGCGKTATIERVMAMSPKGVCAHVHVGRMLREKYPTSKFKGRAAVEETEDEAMALMESGIKQAIRDGATFIFVDGQPRTQQQVDRFMSLIQIEKDNPLCGVMLCSILLHATTGARFDRIQDRDHGDPERLSLSRERLHNDLIDGYGVICKMMDVDWRPEAIDTSRLTIDQVAMCVIKHIKYKHELGMSLLSVAGVKPTRNIPA